MHASSTRCICTSRGISSVVCLPALAHRPPCSTSSSDEAARFQSRSTAARLVLVLYLRFKVPARAKRAGMQPISVIAPYLPTQLHRQRDAARKEIGRIFAGIIAKRRASGVKENDILQTFIDGHYKRVNGGRALTEGEITGMLIAALFAGMHTSTITSSWTGIFLAANRTAWDACVAEQRKIVAEFGEDLSVEALEKMDVLHACITEALRLHPPLIMLLRYARKAFEVTGARPNPCLQSCALPRPCADRAAHELSSFWACDDMLRQSCVMKCGAR